MSPTYASKNPEEKALNATFTDAVIKSYTAYHSSPAHSI